MYMCHIVTVAHCTVYRGHTSDVTCAEESLRSMPMEDGSEQVYTSNTTCTITANSTVFILCTYTLRCVVILHIGWLVTILLLL
jgi:hypothetical protein